MNQTLNIEAFCLGQWQTNCYVLWIDGERDCWVIDAGFTPEPMIQQIQERGLTPSRLILTHGHLDHIAGIRAFKSTWPNLPVWIHEAEKHFLSDPAENLSMMLENEIIMPDADELMCDGQQMTLGELTFDLLHTPGHSPGGVTIYQADKKIAIVGDTLFAGSIGRYDFPHSDGPTLMRSIEGKLMTMPDDVRVYPGHGPDSTIGHERATNPFLQERLV